MFKNIYQNGKHLRILLYICAHEGIREDIQFDSLVGESYSLFR